MTTSLFLVVLLTWIGNPATSFSGPGFIARRQAIPSALRVASFSEVQTDSLSTSVNVDVSSTANDESNDVPSLGKIQKMLPRESFDIDTGTSLVYFGVDLLAVGASLGFLNAVVTSDLYHSFPVWQQALTVAPLQVLAGFACWCMWCIGHDAGHGTVSKKNWINRIVGEVAHSMICLTPFVPWKKSHLRHHLNHNHISRDYSHQWFIREEKDELHPIFLMAYETRNLQLPLLYLVYLLFGVPDGGHVIFYGKLWEGAQMKEKLNAALSAVVSIATAGTLWMNMERLILQLYAWSLGSSAPSGCLW